MGFIRRAYRISLLFLWCPLLMTAAAIAWCLAGSVWRKVACGAFFARIWAAGSTRIIGVRPVLRGALPEDQGVLVVSNHLGYLDVLAHGTFFKLRFAPKAEIRRWPFFGWLVALGSPVWIDRNNPRMAAEYERKFRETMEHGVSMLVYPEGTSTDGRHGLLPFKSTPFAAALSGRSRILPTLLFYRARSGAEESGSWHDDTPFAVHLWRVLGAKGVDIDVWILPEIRPLPGESRKELAQRVHDIMEKEYWKIEKLS